MKSSESSESTPKIETWTLMDIVKEHRRLIESKDFDIGQLNKQFISKEHLKSILDEFDKWECDSSEDKKHYWTSDNEDNPKEIICMHCCINFKEELKKRLGL